MTNASELAPDYGATYAEQIPSKIGTISAIGSAAAPFVFFDVVPFGKHDHGIFSVTLTASRQIGILPDNMTVAVDHVAMAHLRGSLQAFTSLRKMIDDLILHAATPEDTRN